VNQDYFNKFVDSYNEDFIFFLKRAASGNYNCLITSARILRDFHDLVIFMQKTSEYKFEIVPYPFTFRHGSEYYRTLGFDDAEIDKIHGFFEHVKVVYKKEFEECLEEDTEFLSLK
jgi:hypothetical protein